MRDAELVTMLLLIGTIGGFTGVSSSGGNPISPLQRDPRWRRHLLPSFLEHRPHGTGVNHQGHNQQQPNPLPDRKQQIHYYDTQNIYPSVTFSIAPPKWEYVDDSQNIYPSVTFANAPPKWEYADGSQNNDPVMTVKNHVYVYENPKTTSSIFEYRPYTTYYSPDSSKYKSSVFNDIVSDNEIDINGSFKFTRSTNLFASPSSQTNNNDNFKFTRSTNLFTSPSSQTNNNDNFKFTRSTNLFASPSSQTNNNDNIKFTRSTNLFAPPSALNNNVAQTITEFIPNHSVEYQAATVPYTQISQTYIDPFPFNTNNNVERPIPNQSVEFQATNVPYTQISQIYIDPFPPNTNNNVERPIPNQSVEFQAANVPYTQISQIYIDSFSSNTNNDIARPIQNICFPSTVTDTKIHYVTTDKISTLTVCPVSSALDDYLRPVSIPPETIKVYSTITYTFPQSTVTVCPVLPVNDYHPPIAIPINDYLPPINSKTVTASLTKYITITTTLPPITVIDVETETSFRTSTSYLTSTQTETISRTSTKTSTAYVRDIHTVTETQPPQTIEVTITSKEFFISTVFQPVVEYVTEIQTQYSQYCGGYGYKIPSSTFNI